MKKMADKNSRPVVSGFRQRAHKGVDNMLDKAEDIGKSSRKEMDIFNKKVRTMKGNVASYIQKHPEKSVLVATGIGALVGGVVTASRMRKKT